MRKCCLSVAFGVCSLFTILGQSHAPAAKVQQLIESFANSKELQDALVGFCLIQCSNGEIVGQLNKDKLLMPASVQKLLTTAAMLDIQGGAFRYMTPIYLEGTQQDSLWHGNLLIEGKGDPSFASDQMPGAMTLQGVIDTVAAALRSKGINRILGRIVIDQSFIRDIPENPEWLWYDIGNYYGAGCRALNILENTARVSVLLGSKDGDRCEIIQVVPEELDYRYCSEIFISYDNLDKDIFVLGTSLNEYYTAFGNIAKGKEDTLTLKASIPDPAHSMGYIMRKRLMAHGITVEDQYILCSHRELLLIVKSPPLKELIARALRKSVNLYCESFVHQIGSHVLKSTNRARAVSAIKDYWAKAGLMPNSYYYIDGSGLSPKNAISAYQLSQALRWYCQSTNHKHFYKYLPDAAEEGPLSGYLKTNKGIRRKLFLKSGTMERVRSYSGYIVHGENVKYSVTLIINNFTCSTNVLKKKMAYLFSELCKV